LIAYLDTSVLVAAFTRDAQTERALTWLRGKPSLVVSNWAAAEFGVAIRRKQRLGELDSDGVSRAEVLMDALVNDPASYRAVLAEDISTVRDVVKRYAPLRAPDALHLAVARRLEMPLATFDKGLREAARASATAIVDL
jgi:uncharacterized protein